MPRPQKSVPARTKGSRSAKATQRGPQKRGEQTRRRILEAAEELFARYGYSDTSLDVIAEQVGMHPPGIFYYFPDKWALYEAVVDDAMGELDRITTASLASAGCGTCSARSSRTRTRTTCTTCRARSPAPRSSTPPPCSDSSRVATSRQCAPSTRRRPPGLRAPG